MEDWNELEETAKQAVASIRGFISTIREFPEFSASQERKCRKGAEQQGVIPLNQVRIYPRLSLPLATSNAAASIPFIEERRQVVYDILIPLLKDLTESYRQLDVKILPHPTGTSVTSNNQAPPGLLSLSDYTDIGCLLEFLVTTSILPNLEPFILYPADKRIRTLPKALQGRMPSRAYLWGTAVAVESSSPNQEELAHELRLVGLTMAKLCTTARFQPMFLPRHMVDICAALHQSFHSFQTVIGDEQHQQQLFWKLPSIEDEWELHFLHQLGFLSSLDVSKTNSRILDPIFSIKAYQSLLSFGSKNAPYWLRCQVSRQLASLARTDLDAILYVFVHVADSLPGADRTAAATRLAYTLTRPPASSSTTNSDSSDDQNVYYNSILSQLANSLDNYIGSKLNNKEGTRSVSSSLAGPLTAAALVPLLLPRHKDMVRQFWIQRLLSPLCNTDRQTTTIISEEHISKITNRFYVWICCTTPPTPALSVMLSYESCIVSSRHVRNNKESFRRIGRYTVLQLLLRIAASAPLSSHLDTIRRTIAQILQSLVLPINDSNRQQLVTVAICIVHSVAPTPYDIEGETYFAPSSNNGCCESRLRNQLLEDNSGQSLLELQARCKVMVQILRQINIENGATEAEGKDSTMKGRRLPLSACVFEVLFHIYLSLLPKSSTAFQEEEFFLPKIMRLEPVKLAALHLLPMLIETCEIDELLGSSATRIFGMIRSVLIAGISDFRNAEDLKLGTFEWLDSAYLSQDADNALADLLRETSNSNDQSEKDQQNDDQTSNDSLISVSSLCLSLLLAILELGNPRRESNEEDCLRALLPVVKLYAADLDVSKNPLEAAARSNMAEVAAHICALIISRDAPNENDELRKENDDEVAGRMRKRLVQAEQDLQSDMAPLRARGMVCLMRAVRAEVNTRDHSIFKSTDAARCIVTEVGGDDVVAAMPRGSSENEWDRDTMNRMLNLVTLALKDNESYVFLAAVQTLSALCDIVPSYFMPKLATALSRGVFVISDTEGSEGTRVELSLSQRIKVAEALMFAIRRRGEALGHYATSLVVELLRGCQVNCLGDLSLADDNRVLDTLIQQQTHLYLEHGTYEVPPEGDLEESADIATEKEEKRNRAAAGGPMFAVEELDAVRSGCYSCLAEVITQLEPNSVTRYVSQIVYLCLDALRLDKTRPVRRSAALLSREVYRAVLREGEKGVEFQNKSMYQCILPMTLELVSSGCEATLAATLKQISALNETSGNRHYDPATDARCQEALNARHLCEEFGYLALASAMAKEMKQRDRSLQNAPGIVRDMLSGGTSYSIQNISSEWMYPSTSS